MILLKVSKIGLMASVKSFRSDKQSHQPAVPVVSLLQGIIACQSQRNDGKN